MLFDVESVAVLLAAAMLTRYLLQLSEELVKVYLPQMQLALLFPGLLQAAWSAVHRNLLQVLESSAHSTSTFDMPLV